MFRRRGRPQRLAERPTVRSGARYGLAHEPPGAGMQTVSSQRSRLDRGVRPGRAPTGTPRHAPRTPNPPDGPVSKRQGQP